MWVTLEDALSFSKSSLSKSSKSLTLTSKTGGGLFGLFGSAKDPSFDIFKDAGPCPQPLSARERPSMVIAGMPTIGNKAYAQIIKQNFDGKTLNLAGLREHCLDVMPYDPIAYAFKGLQGSTLYVLRTRPPKKTMAGGSDASGRNVTVYKEGICNIGRIGALVKNVWNGREQQPISNKGTLPVEYIKKIKDRDHVDFSNLLKDCLYLINYDPRVATFVYNEKLRYIVLTRPPRST